MVVIDTNKTTNVTLNEQIGNLVVRHFFLIIIVNVCVEHINEKNGSKTFVCS